MGWMSFGAFNVGCTAIGYTIPLVVATGLEVSDSSSLFEASEVGVSPLVGGGEGVVWSVVVERTGLVV